MPFKLYVDRRFRKEVGGSQSDSEFSIELPHPINVRGKAFCDVCLIPNTFYSIRANENDKIHIRETSVYRICTIVEGQYNASTLKDAVLVALNTNRTIGVYTATYDANKNHIVISNADVSATFHIYSSAFLRSPAGISTWSGAALNLNNLMSSDRVVGFSTAQVSLDGDSNTNIALPDAVNTLPYHQLFLRSSIGLGYDAIGADGSCDIIRRIVCQVPLNDMIVDTHSMPTDSISIGDRQISSLSFRLTDVYGATVDTKGHAISFSIIFVDEE